MLSKLPWHLCWTCRNKSHLYFGSCVSNARWLTFFSLSIVHGSLRWGGIGIGNRKSVAGEEGPPRFPLREETLAFALYGCAFSACRGCGRHRTANWQSLRLAGPTTCGAP